METLNGAVDLSHDLILRVKVDSRTIVSWSSNILARGGQFETGSNNLNHSGPRLCGVGAQVQPSRFLLSEFGIRGGDLEIMTTNPHTHL